jgi:hypothetical protein
MRSTFIAPLCAVLMGLLAWSQVAVAQQKTAKQCNAEWAADKAAIQASGKSKRAFMAECRGLPASAPVADSVLAKGQYVTEAEAKTSCPTDHIVWVNLKSRISHAADSASYGNTKRGAYMCQNDSTAAGFRPPKNPFKGANPA